MRRAGDGKLLANLVFSHALENVRLWKYVPHWMGGGVLVKNKIA
jgi:hypothetical protein